MFKCDKCGCCCRNLNKTGVYVELDRGDGTCKYLKKSICSIYDSRPLICRVDEFYDRFLKKEMSLEVYYKANYEICETMKKEEKK